LITTWTPIADIADHEPTSALRRDLEQLSLLLRAGNFDPWHPYFSPVGCAAH